MKWRTQNKTKRFNSFCNVIKTVTRFLTLVSCVYSYTISSSDSAGPIPVGIAVARQRLQEHAQQQQQHQTKDINRFSNIGIATDLGEFLLSNSFRSFFSTVCLEKVISNWSRLVCGIETKQNISKDNSIWFTLEWLLLIMKHLKTISMEGFFLQDLIKWKVCFILNFRRKSNFVC